ncbi:MAG: sulfotransferase [Ornithinimicrobium sp.]
MLGSSLKSASPRWVKDAANTATRKYALATVRDRPAPDFLIVGTKRGGTTSLFNYLLMHPGVLGLFPQSRGKKSTDYFFKDYGRGEAWYRSHFHAEQHRRRLARTLGYAPVGGEASPFYIWDPRIVHRVQRTSPAVKAVMLLRDPTRRAWSHFLERKQNGVEPLDFEQALEAEEARTSGELEAMLADPSYHSEAYDWYSYRARGVYLPQLLHWRSVFPSEQLLVLRSEDLYADVQGTVDTVCDFLGIGRHLLPTDRTFNASRPGPRMREETRRELAQFYAPHNAQLEEHLGRTMGWQTPHGG